MQLYAHTSSKPGLLHCLNLNANAEDLNPILCNICKNIPIDKMLNHVLNSCLYKRFSSFKNISYSLVNSLLLRNPAFIFASHSLSQLYYSCLTGHGWPSPSGTTTTESEVLD